MPRIKERAKVITTVIFNMIKIGTAKWVFAEGGVPCVWFKKDPRTWKTLQRRLNNWHFERVTVGDKDCRFNPFFTPDGSLIHLMKDQRKDGSVGRNKGNTTPRHLNPAPDNEGGGNGTDDEGDNDGDAAAIISSANTFVIENAGADLNVSVSTAPVDNEIACAATLLNLRSAAMIENAPAIIDAAATADATAAAFNADATMTVCDADTTTAAFDADTTTAAFNADTTAAAPNADAIAAPPHNIDAYISAAASDPIISGIDFGAFFDTLQDAGDAAFDGVNVTDDLFDVGQWVKNVSAMEIEDASPEEGGPESFDPNEQPAWGALPEGIPAGI